MVDDTIWFKHSALAGEDEKVLSMRTIHGAAGYGVFWLIVERMRREKKYHWPHSEHMIRGLALAIRESEDLVGAVVKTCIKLRLFRDDASGLHAPALERRMKKYEEFVDSRRRAGSHGARKRWHSTAIARPKHSYSTAIAQQWQVDSKSIAMGSDGKGSEGKEKTLSALPPDVDNPGDKSEPQETEWHLPDSPQGSPTTPTGNGNCAYNERGKPVCSRARSKRSAYCEDHKLKVAELAKSKGRPRGGGLKSAKDALPKGWPR